MKTSNNIVLKILGLFVLLFPTMVFAQPPEFTEDIVDVPIDGGLSLLIAAGVGMGIKKLKKDKSK
jgi:hypothetical protein